MGTVLQNHKQYLLSGVSFAIPFIACGGILIAVAIAFSPMTEKGPDSSQAPQWVQMVETVGVASFTLLLPVLGGYIAYAMAGKPGLVGGFVGGFVAGQIGAGFLGALVAGLLAGHVVGLMKKLKVPKMVRPVMPILIIPIISALVVGGLMLEVLGVPIANLMVWLGVQLESLSEVSAVLLALVLGAMIAFDMGGPVNKAAFFFGAGLIEQGSYTVMGACAAAICVPPLGMGLATVIGRKWWSEQERDAGLAALGMGAMGITEGAIPFAAADPVRIIPTIMAGSMVAAVIAMLAGVQDHAPHGGPIVLPVIGNRVMFIVAILAGTVTTAVLANLLKRRAVRKLGTQGDSQ